MGITNTVLKLKAYFDEWHSNTPHSANSLTDKTALFKEIYPIGSIYITVNKDFKPATAFGGTWERIEGAFLFGATINQATLARYPKWASGETGGEHDVELKFENLPNHTHLMPEHRHRLPNSAVVYNSNGNHTQNASSGGTKSSFNTNLGLVTEEGKEVTTNQNFIVTGGIHGISVVESVNNMPPYVAVNIWKRTG